MSLKDRSELAVLAALAWADGEVTPEEAEALRRTASRMDLTAEERAELETLLREPVPLDRFEALVGELRRTHPTAEDQRLLLERADGMTRADDRLDPEEERRVAILRAVLEPAEAGSLLGRLRGVLGTAKRSVREAGDAVTTPLRALLERAERDPGGPGRPAREDRARLTLVGLLARRVAPAGGLGAATPAADVRPALQRAMDLSTPEVEMIVAAMRSEERTEADRQRLCAELNRRSDEGERLRVLRGLFAVAAAGGPVTREEESEIRLIANYLWIDPQEFHRVRLEMTGERP
jgi:uncharacterized tellurite resistance protein B-like protein